MKYIFIVVLILFGAYWLFIHTPPHPLNHESLGLYNHDIHRIIGVILIAASGLVAWKWKK
jgi:hypothetical protein